MFRYRCPQCSVVLMALEIRAGKATVCMKCSRPVTIPADRRFWLNEKGEPLVASPTMVIPSGSGITPAPPPPRSETPPQPEPTFETDSDVLGAIAHGDAAAVKEISSAETPPPPEVAPPTPTFSRSLPYPDDDDEGRVELYPTSSPASEVLPKAASAPTPPPRKPIPTPPPASALRPRTLVAAAGTPNEPVRLKTSADLAVELTSTLASRMKPAPKPPRDLKPSTAVWILTTGLAVAFAAGTLFTHNNFTQAVIVIGAAQILAGYAWITTLAFRRDVRRGIACAVPPVTFVYLTNWKYAKYRPLRFVISGALVLGLGLLIPKLTTQTRTWAGTGETQTPVERTTPITEQPKLIQLRHYRDQRQYDSLMLLLRTLARTDSTYSVEAKDRVELALELHRLCTHPDVAVRTEALAAYTTWGGSSARDIVLDASRSSSADERTMALQLLPRWKDEDVARRIAEMIGRPGTETSRAQEALITLGGPVAERAAIALLRKDDQNIRLTAIDILGNEKIGGHDAIAALREIARTSPDPGTRQPAEAKAELIEMRLKK
jgi:hypothetical protein